MSPIAKATAGIGSLFSSALGGVGSVLGGIKQQNPYVPPMPQVPAPTPSLYDPKSMAAADTAPRGSILSSTLSGPAAGVVAPAPRARKTLLGQ